MTLPPTARLDRGLGSHARTRRRLDVVRRLQLADYARDPELCLWALVGELQWQHVPGLRQTVASTLTITEASPCV